MASYLRFKSTFPRLKPLFRLQRFTHTLGERELEAEFAAELGPKTMPVSEQLETLPDAAHVDPLEWKKVDSLKLGVSLSMISEASRIVVKMLQNEGYDAYLVGGCIRDLLLKKAPKDYDVITTATLHEIKKKFHRAYIVGRRFPICQVHVRGSIIEVSSFATIGTTDMDKVKAQLSKMPKGYDEKDITRWCDSLKRDFTVNSLFYDPFAGMIYDYSSGMTDLMFLKLRTLVPANLSFKTDCARILRALRIAARLGLSITEDVDRALHNLYASVATLDKARLHLEMNYMLSYGSSQASLLLLKRFNLLDVLLPFQASYLADHSGTHSPLMLMDLFSNLDSVVSCEQPCDSRLWISLLAFHNSLVRHPQNALVVWTFSSVLFHANWKEGVKAARELTVRRVNFVPEILESSNDLTNDELAERVTNFASTVQDSLGAWTDPESLIKAVGDSQSSPSSLPVFISKKARRDVAQIFSVLVHDIESWKEERHSDSIDYKLLGKGDAMEIRFVLGKIIMDTLRGGVSQCRPKLRTEKKQDWGKSKFIITNKQVLIEKSISTFSDIETEKSKYSMNQKRSKKKPSDSEKELIKDKIIEIMSTKNVELKNNDRQKKSLKEVEDLHSLQKQSKCKDAKLEGGKHEEVEDSKGVWRVLEKASKGAREQKVETAQKVVKTGKRKSKDRVEQGSGEADDQVKKQRSTIKNNSREKKGEVLKTLEISQDNQLQKKPRKMVEKLLPLQKKLNRKDAKLDGCKMGEAEADQEIPSVKAHKIIKEHISELERSKSKRGIKRETRDPDNENELHQQRPTKQNNKNMACVLEQKVGENLERSDKDVKETKYPKEEEPRNRITRIWRAFWNRR